MKNANIIFLDIDGVLNTSNHIEWRFKRPEGERGTHDDWCAQACENINTLADKVGDTRIVISSTWRLGRTIKQLRKLMSRNGIRVPLIDKTPSLSTVEAKTATPITLGGDFSHRGVEIHRWLEEHRGYVRNFVILDDDEDMLPPQEEYFVRCNHQDGFANFDKLKQAIKILSK